jgi:hypothetical protein
MKTYTGIYDAKEDLMRYLLAKGPTLPDNVREAMITGLNAPSPVDAIVQASEALYAANAAGKLDNAGRDVVAGAMGFLSSQDLHGYQSNERGNQIAMAMIRENGGKAPPGYTMPKKADDPDVDDKFKPAPPPPPAPATAKPV